MKKFYVCALVGIPLNNSKICTVQQQECLYFRISKKYLTFVLVIVVAPCAMRHYIQFVKLLYYFRCLLSCSRYIAKADCCKPKPMFRSICNLLSYLIATSLYLSKIFTSFSIITHGRAHNYFMKYDHWGDLGVDGWIILGWISRRWDVGIWTGLGWTRIETGGGRL